MAHGWLLVPFDCQHPVRGLFGDPRIRDRGGKSFHFGVEGERATSARLSSRGSSRRATGTPLVETSPEADVHEVRGLWPHSRSSSPAAS